jgi:hypothetical protein
MTMSRTKEHFEESVEIPLPEAYFRNLGIGSRATFFRWEKAGLRIVRVGGRRFIYRSDLKSFLEMMDQKAVNDSLS